MALALGAALAVHGGAASPARAEGEASPLVVEANRKARQHDVSGAIKLLEQAIAADPKDVDAHIRYQDLAAEALGTAGLMTKYGEAAKARPDDPVAQFLATRLLPPTQALPAFEAMSGQFKDSPWPAAGRARALEDLGRFADAVAAHSDAVQRAGANSTRFLAYRAYGYERGGQWQLAVDAWNAFITKAPNDVSARFGLAEALRRAERYDEAIAALDLAGKLGAGDPEFVYRKGLVEIDAGRTEKALEAFDAALALDKGMTEALCAACETAVKSARAKAVAEKRDLEEKDFDRAIGYGDRAAVSSPDSPYAHFVLGAAHEAAAEVNSEAHIDLALKEYDAALALLPIPGPDKVRVLTAKAYVLLAKAEWDQAIDAAQKAIDIDKNCIAAYGHAGHGLAAQNKQNDAITRYYKPALKIDPKSARILHDMGVALWELKKPNDARKPLEDARTFDPKNGRYRLTLGELYYELKRNKEAVAELFEATELLPRDAEAWRAYGRACYSAKSWDECAKGYEKVVALDPEAVDDYLYLGAVYADQLKDRVKARAAITKFREKGGSDDNLEDWMNQLLDDTGGNKP